MPAVLVAEPLPAELDALLERRRETGADRWDEVWQGVLHLIPPPSHGHARLLIRLGGLLDRYAASAGLEITAEIGIGLLGDFRVPDLALHRPGAATQWHPTVALAVEILSPHDRAWEKLPFYAAHDVDEVLIVDPQTREVHWLALTGGNYEPTEHSNLIELGPAELVEQIDWPLAST